MRAWYFHLLLELLVEHQNLKRLQSYRNEQAAILRCHNSNFGVLIKVKRSLGQKFAGVQLDFVDCQSQVF